MSYSFYQDVVLVKRYHLSLIDNVRHGRSDKKLIKISRNRLSYVATLIIV